MSTDKRNGELLTPEQKQRSYDRAVELRRMSTTWERMAATPTAELSSRERSEQADAMFAQVATLTRDVARLGAQNVALVAECKVLREQIRAANGNMDRLAGLYSSFMALGLRQRLRWLVLGR